MPDSKLGARDNWAEPATIASADTSISEVTPSRYDILSSSTKKRSAYSSTIQGLAWDQGQITKPLKSLSTWQKEGPPRRVRLIMID